MRTNPFPAILFLLAGCGGGSGGGAAPAPECPAPVPFPTDRTEAALDLSGAGGFWSLPWPSDPRLAPDGRLDLAGFPNPKALALVDRLLATAETDVAGYSTAGPIYLPLTGPLDVARLPRDPAAYASPSAPVQLADVDPTSPERGRRFPLQVGFTTAADGYRPAYLLQALPYQGVELREGTTYALFATTAVCAPRTSVLAANPALTALLRGETPPGALGARARAAYAPLAAQLAREGVAPERIVAATAFTTGRATEKLLRIGEKLDAFPAPAPLGTLARTAEFPEYCVLSGAWRAPHFQDGTPPFLPDGGAFRFDAAGNPAPQGGRDAPFVVTIPKARMPARGFPLLLYLHGTGGRSTQVYERGEQRGDGSVDPGGGPAQIAAERGWAAAGMGGFLSVEHLGPLSLDGFAYNNFFNPPAMRDNAMQMVAEEMLFRRLVSALRIPAPLCPGADASASPDGTIRVDPETQALMGQSLGSQIAGPLAAADPKGWRGVILTGAGGSWILYGLATDTPVPAILRDVLFQLPEGEALDLWHPLLAVAEHVLGPSGTIHFLPKLLRAPPPGRGAPHALAIEGFKDLQIPSLLQRPLAAALGADLVGPEVGPTPEDQILPAILLGGRTQLPYPASANVEVPGLGARTGAVLRYPEDGLREGHYVAFQREEPKHQYGCFLADLARGRAPVVIEGVRQGDPCAP